MVGHRFGVLLWLLGPSSLPILLASITFNYFAGRIVLSRKDRPTRLAAVWLAIVVNLSALGYFKYANFFLNSLHIAAGTPVPAGLEIALPIGISFFTFTQIAFLVDCYKSIAAEPRFSHYLLFVSYFPHLIAGPILHHKQMMPQFAGRIRERISTDTMLSGMCIFAIGLAKKVLLADPFGDISDAMFNGVSKGFVPTFGSAWLGVLAYTLQIYFDFSGYSDMAIGASLMFGISLPINFNSPYKASSIIEFWRRWHISLSNFLRDYLYIPLGGNRHGEILRHANLIVTMLLGGLWHGANWTFILWGGMHGIFLVTAHLWQRIARRRLSMRSLEWALTFFAVVFAWVMFRASSVSDAVSIYSAMLHPSLSVGPFASLKDLHWQALLQLFGPVAWLVVGFGLVVIPPNSNEMAEGVVLGSKSNGNIKLVRGAFSPAHVAFIGLTFGASLVMMSNVSKFLYFQF